MIERVIRGADLRAERARAGLTQSEVAARMGVHRQRVTGIEAAERPSARVQRRYLAALGLDIETVEVMAVLAATLR